MAEITAAQDGPWSDTATWVGGVVPGAGDTVRDGGFTVTLDVDITVLQLFSSGDNGKFLVTESRTITCTQADDGIDYYTGNNPVLHVDAPAPAVVTINADCLSRGPGSGDLPRCCVYVTNSGTTTINGTVRKNTAISSWDFGATVHFDGSGVLNINSNIAGEENGGGTAINECNTVRAYGTGALNIVGNVSGQNGGLVNRCCAVAVWGGSPIITITGDLIATGNGAALDMYRPGGELILIGDAYASADYSAVTKTAGTAQFTWEVRGTLYASAEGAFPIVEGIWRKPSTGQTVAEFRQVNGSAIQFYSDVDLATVGNLPAEADVRAGAAYGADDALTGTMAVPLANAVGAGVPVDDTVGTQAITPADVWAVATAALTESGSIGERLAQAATVETVAAQVAALE